MTSRLRTLTRSLVAAAVLAVGLCSVARGAAGPEPAYILKASTDSFNVAGVTATGDVVLTHQGDLAVYSAGELQSLNTGLYISQILGVNDQRQALVQHYDWWLGTYGLAMCEPGKNPELLTPPSHWTDVTILSGPTNSGLIVGAANIGPTLRHGVCWSPTLGWRDLTPRAQNAVFWGANDRNEAIGTQFASINRVVYFNGIGAQLLDAGMGQAINNRGDKVVMTENGDLEIWDADGHHQLGKPDPAGGFQAAGINDAGTVAGTSFNWNTGRQFAFVASAAGGIRELPTPAGWSYPRATGINSQGMVAGTGSDATGNYQACYWDADGVVHTFRFPGDTIPGVTLNAGPGIFAAEDGHVYGSVSLYDPTAYTVRNYLYRSADAGESQTDTTPPALSGAEDVVAQGYPWDWGTGTWVYYWVSATDNFDPAPTVTYDIQPGSFFPVGTTTVHVTATDVYGNQSAASFDVTVLPPTPPIIHVPDTIVVEATDPTGAVVTFEVTAEDPMAGGGPKGGGSSVTPEADWSSGDTFPLGATTVHVHASGIGGESTASFDVVVLDTTAPDLTVPDAVTLTANDPAGFRSTGLPFGYAVWDAVDLAPAVTPAQGDALLLPFGTTNLAVTATDASGNSVTRQVGVTVPDTVPPTIETPGSITVQATGPSGAAVSFTVGAKDNADPSPTVTTDPVSGSTFPVGTTTVHVTATDASGNSASASFDVTVVDATPPVVTATANTNSIWPPNGKMVPVVVSGKVTTGPSGLASASYRVVDSYGKVQPSGSISVKADGTYSVSVSLEAARNGNDKAGRTYTLTFTVKDRAGKTGSASVVVTVPHDQGK
jgi:hypothetical protein